MILESDRKIQQVHVLLTNPLDVKATHIRLIKGVVKYNPHLKVLCPPLSNGYECRKGKVEGKKEDWLRPRLLVKNFGNPNLQLWSCKGCEDKFLLRVQVRRACG